LLFTVMIIKLIVTSRSLKENITQQKQKISNGRWVDVLSDRSCI